MRAYNESRNVTRVGIADDFYLVGSAMEIAAGWPNLKRVLKEAGHELRDPKCAAFYPALDHLAWTADRPLPEGAAQLTSKVRRSLGGLPLLGTAAQGAWETALGPYAAVAQPAAKRATAAITACNEAARYAASAPCPDSAQIAWTVTSRSIAHALSYDARLCPPKTLATAENALRAAIRTVVDATAGAALTDHEHEQTELPGALGGMCLRTGGEAPSAASYVATWLTHRDAIPKIATRLGKPHTREVDTAEAHEALVILRANGIDMQGDVPTFTPTARERYEAGPWIHDTPTSEVFTVPTELPHQTTAGGKGQGKGAGPQPHAHGGTDYSAGGRRRVFG